MSRIEARARLHLDIAGVVQGTGFRPFVYRTATALGLDGWVVNTAQGVTLEAEGAPERLAELRLRIVRDAPRGARVAAVRGRAVPAQGGTGFAIREAAAGGIASAELLPDLATCAECLRELHDPGDRRYRYPFINCTQCGPRYSIVERLPYARAATTMRSFTMCAACQAEYDDPSSRRFHAEPNACAECGPRLALLAAHGDRRAERDEALRRAIEAIRAGEILALKGLGGFHLLVDARDEAAVARLRRRKARAEKPFALMFPTLAAIKDCCAVAPAEEQVLLAPERPIVLLRRRGGELAPSVAPGGAFLGAMLPYTPLHHLLLDALGFPLVATSGNRAEEPIAIDTAEALDRLAGIADAFLVHDRPIVRPLDDSVARVVAGRELVLRRGRGYAPGRIAARGAPGVLAVGGHLKSTVALSQGEGILLGPHIGDLDGPAARAAHRRAMADLAALAGAAPQWVAHDLHPDYASSRAAEASGLPPRAVQHHLAHVASCMAENGLAPPVLGVAWDGAGLGTDGTLWGGEFLRIDAGGWRRVARLRPFRLPGGEMAMREPRRAALGLLFAASGAAALDRVDLAPVADFAASERRVLGAMLQQGVNAPLTSSIGRLFDAVAALCGLCQRAAWEGQAALALEGAIDPAAVGEALPFAVREGVEPPLELDWAPALARLLELIAAGATVGRIARAFHLGLAQALAEIAERLAARDVALSGGCFQNAALTEAAIEALAARGITAHWHRRVPPNDGGLALGQAYWIAREVRPCA